MQGVYARNGSFQGNDGVREGAQARKPVQALPGRTFASVDAVARWAFAVVERSAAKAANYAPTIVGTGEKMTPLELRAQAAMVISSIKALPEDQADYMLAAYGWDADAARAVGALKLRAARNLPPDRPELSAALVERHFSAVRGIEVEGLRLVAARHQVGHRVVRTRDDRVRAWLSPVWLSAEYTLLRKWELTGLINP